MRSQAAEITQLIHAGARQIVDGLRRAASEGLTVGELSDVLQRAFTDRNQVDYALSLVMAAFDRAAESPDDRLTFGRAPAAWLSETLNISPNAAYAQLHLARRLPELPGTAAAFERGELSSQHAGVVSRTVESVQRGGGDAARAEREMLQEAAGRDPRDLHRWGLSLVHRLAPRQLEDHEERMRRSRYLHLRELFHGGYSIEAFLDPVAGATLKTALDGVLGPRRKSDERTPGQRRADAVVELARRVLDGGELPVRGGVRPHLMVTATLETLKGDPGAPAAYLDWGFPISGKALREIATDADLVPILMSKDGDPLHVGRRYRTATPKMRKALAVRDGRCLWPGCDRPPSWTQGNHERDWRHGGRTDVNEMGLVCQRHHTRLNRGWRLERLPGRRAIVHPP
jgi:hypothetical protein